MIKDDGYTGLGILPSVISHKYQDSVDFSAGDTKCLEGHFSKHQGHRFLQQRSTQKPHAHTGRCTCAPSRHPFELPVDKSSGV